MLQSLKIIKNFPKSTGSDLPGLLCKRQYRYVTRYVAKWVILHFIRGGKGSQFHGLISNYKNLPTNTVEFHNWEIFHLQCIVLLDEHGKYHDSGKACFLWLQNGISQNTLASAN